MKALISNKNLSFLLRYIPLTFLVFAVGCMLLLFPEASAQGISDGIDLCLGTLIPSLYPFMVLSTFITQTGLLGRVPTIADKISMKLFRLKGSCLGAILLSMIGGLPLGCKTVSELYKKGEITANQGQRMMLFCFCCGPAFTVSSVGLYMLGSKQAGYIIFLSLILSSLTVGILSRFLDDGSISKNTAYNQTDKVPISLNLVKSVSVGSTAMLSVCAWVVLFSCINRLIEILPVSEAFRFFSYTVLEVTNGVYLSSGKLSLELIAGLIAFGGFCGHCQVMPYIIKLKLKYKHFLTSRIVSGALTVIYCNLLLKLWPVTYEVFAVGALPKERQLTVSAVYSISMLCTAGLFLLGDSAVFRIKTKKDHRN